jgi:hypothetical protein
MSPAGRGKFGRPGQEHLGTLVNCTGRDGILNEAGSDAFIGELLISADFLRKDFKKGEFLLCR